MSGSMSVAITEPFGTAREPHREVAGAGADVGDRHGRGQRERRDHLVGLLPGVARRIVEHLCPLLGVLEPVLHAAGMRLVMAVMRVVIVLRMGRRRGRRRGRRGGRGATRPEAKYEGKLGSEHAAWLHTT